MNSISSVLFRLFRFCCFVCFRLSFLFPHLAAASNEHPLNVLLEQSGIKYQHFAQWHWLSEKAVFRCEVLFCGALLRRKPHRLFNDDRTAMGCRWEVTLVTKVVSIDMLDCLATCRAQLTG